jgi:hypothetical protein
MVRLFKDTAELLDGEQVDVKAYGSWIEFGVGICLVVVTHGGKLLPKY